MKRYLIVTDLDGTLLTSEHKISEYDYNQIKKFKQENGLFTFATGRMNETVHQFIKELHINVPVVTYNGAQVFCPIENKVLYERALPLSSEMYDQLVAASITVEILFFCDDQVFAIRKGELIKEFEQKEKVTCKKLDQVPKVVTKIMMMSTDKGKLEQLESVFQNRFPGISFMYSESEYLEILSGNASKGEALRAMKKHCGITDVYTVGFGNNLNDISLLKEADLGVAVQNAEDGLLKVADQVSRYSNNEGAVGRYIESLLSESSEVVNKRILKVE